MGSSSRCERGRPRGCVRSERCRGPSRCFTRPCSKRFAGGRSTMSPRFLCSSAAPVRPACRYQRARERLWANSHRASSTIEREGRRPASASGARTHWCHLTRRHRSQPPRHRCSPRAGRCWWSLPPGQRLRVLLRGCVDSSAKWSSTCFPTTATGWSPGLGRRHAATRERCSSAPIAQPSGRSQNWASPSWSTREDGP